MLGCLHKLQYEIRKPIPKGPIELLTAFIYKIIDMQCLFTNKINLQRPLLC